MTEKQRRQIWEKTSGHCHFCGDPVTYERRGWREGDLTGYWEVDHVIQRQKGGGSSVQNYLPACTRWQPPAVAPHGRRRAGVAAVGTDRP